MRLCAMCADPMVQTEDGAWTHPKDPNNVDGPAMAVCATGPTTATTTPEPSVDLLYQTRLWEPSRAQERPTARRCSTCGGAVLAVIVDQLQGAAAQRPRVGQTQQALVAACPCGASAAIVGLLGLMTYPAALAQLVSDLADATEVIPEPEDEA